MFVNQPVITKHFDILHFKNLSTWQPDLIYNTLAKTRKLTSEKGNDA